MDTADTTLGEGIFFRSDLPLAWKVVASQPARGELAALNESNGALLRIFSVLDEYSAEAQDGNSEVVQVFSRLDAKLNMVLDLVGEVLAHQLALPSPKALALSERGIQWAEPKTADAAKSGQLLFIELYLKPEYPKPLRFFAQLVKVGDSEKVVAYIARFYGVGEDVQDGLAKLIFRQHRRGVASRRMRES